VSVISSAMARDARRPRFIAIGGPRHEAICRGLVLASAATLFLHDAATVGVSYTLRLSYALVVAACLLGAPFVLRGWRRLPVGVKLAVLLLVLVYLVAGVFGVNPVLSGQGRSSRTRWVVYLLDLGVGLAGLGILVGLFQERRQLRALIVALALGAVLGAIYGGYQWAAQHYGWPLANLDNAPNSDNFTTGARYQGIGLFGWERVRGTFVEPFALGIYLAAIFPLVTQAISNGTRRRTIYTAAALAIVTAALVLTDSSLAWASLCVSVTVVATAAFVARGRPLLAGVAAGAATLLAILCTVAIAEPSLLSSVTARSESELHLTVGARTDAWRQASSIWARRPVLGFGPGASSVELARRDTAVGVTAGPVVLGSAYGIWAASLIDAGVFGLLAWVVLFAVVLIHAAATATRSRSSLLWVTLAAAFAAVLASQVGGDRLDLRVWLLLGLTLAVARWVVESRAAVAESGGVE
jgi:hypothetical protein